MTWWALIAIGWLSLSGVTMLFFRGVARVNNDLTEERRIEMHYPSYKIQEFSGGTWVNLTRAGDNFEQAKRMIEGYFRDYPSRQHRLVLVENRDGREHYVPVSLSERTR
jgi:hypothetical protein